LTRRALLTAGAAFVAASGWPLLRDDALFAAPTLRPVPAWPPGPPLRRARVAFFDDRYTQTKDPCPVLAAGTWHLFGTGWSRGDDRPQILHARASAVDGPYAAANLSIPVGIGGSGVAAPGVIFDRGEFHMFLQTDFARPGGSIEHLTSPDGEGFEHRDTALTSDRDLDEACIYDAQPALIGGKPFIVYAAGRVGHPQIHLAESIAGSWAGPWRRHGAILTEAQISFHNQPGAPEYEWGLEGPQLLELPDGTVLLDAVCFLAGQRRGTRQRVFLAIAGSPIGPYRVMGLPVQPIPGQWDAGENGHAGAVLVDDGLTLLYQGRRSAESRWALGSVTFALPRVEVR
jgi:hypothetical protein